MSGSSSVKIGTDFQKASGVSAKQEKPLLPVSFRVTATEKEKLQRDAGSLSLSAYIRQVLFGDDVSIRPARFLRKQRKPKIDARELARLLATFGKSDMARSILALSLAAQAGELDVSPDVSDKLEQACDDIQEIKLCLIMALGIKPQKDHSS